MYLIFVFGLYAIIYAAPKIEAGRINTDIVEYAQIPIADQVTALFVRDETLYSAAYSGRTNYMITAGTKVRAGTQVLYIEPGTPPPAQESPDAAPAFVTASAVVGGSDQQGGAASDKGGEDGYAEASVQSVMTVAGADAVVSEGGVTPTTAIVSYCADGWEQKITPDNIMSLPKSVFDNVPLEATDLTREWVAAGEPVYRITNNNLWRVAFWINDADKTVLDKYQVGRKVILDLGTTKVRAAVESAEPRGKDIFVVLRSDMYFKDLDKYRLRDISVVFSEVSGAVISKQAVKLKSGQTGVYVKQLSGAFKWTPVKVLKESGACYVVAESRYDDKDSESVATIRYYDEIMSDPVVAGY